MRVVDVYWEEVMLAVGGSGEGGRDGRKERPISIRYMGSIEGKQVDKQTDRYKEEYRKAGM